MSISPTATQATSYDGWFLYHSAGVYPGQGQAVGQALIDFTADWCAADNRRWDVGLQARDALMGNWATLIGAPKQNLFAAQNVTEAFARCIDALGDKYLGGRVVLIAADCFPSLHFLLSGLAERHGFTLRTVPTAPGHHTVRDDDFLSAWSADVALALLTWVSSLTSKRADLSRLISHARQHGSFVAVDITQGAGILPFDLAQYPADFVCGSTLKWLCGMPGAAFGYVGPRLSAVDMVPAMRGWFSQSNPFNWDLDAFAFAPDARRFDTGTPSVLPFIASRPGFGWILAQPEGTLRAHNLALCHRLIALIDRLGLPLLSPRDDDMRGASVMAAIPERYDIAHITAALMAAGLWADFRGRTLRLSPGVLTTHAGVDRLEQVLSDAFNVEHAKGSR